MDINTIVSQAMNLPSAQVDIASWNFEKAYLFAVEVAVLVNKSASSSHAQNVKTLVSVVDAVLLQLKAKAVALAAPETATAVSQSWDNL